MCAPQAAVVDTDFKMKLIMKDFEKQLLAHHSGHVHLEAGTTTSSGSSRRRLQSACRHFSFWQPCLNPPHPLHWLFEAGRPQAAYRCLCDKPRPVSARSVGCFGLGDALWVWMSRPATSGGLRWLKTVLFGVTQADGRKALKDVESEGKEVQKVGRQCEIKQQGVSNSACRNLY